MSSAGWSWMWHGQVVLRETSKIPAVTVLVFFQMSLVWSSISIFACVCVCLCVCVWERERDRQTDRQRQTDRDRDRDRETEFTERERERNHPQDLPEHNAVTISNIFFTVLSTPKSDVCVCVWGGGGLSVSASVTVKHPVLSLCGRWALHKSSLLLFFPAHLSVWKRVSHLLQRG